MTGQSKFITKAMGLVMKMEKMIGRDLEDGRKNLKTIAEANAKKQPTASR